MHSGVLATDRTVGIWDVRTGKQQRRITGHDGWIRSVAFSHDGKLIVSGSDDHTVRVWSEYTGK